MTLTELLRPIDITCVTDGSAYYLFDDQDALDLAEEFREDGAYFDIVSVIESAAVVELWYSEIVNDLWDEYGCEEDLEGDLILVQEWMDTHQDDIDLATYTYYTEVIQSILHPETVEDDARYVDQLPEE